MNLLIGPRPDEQFSSVMNLLIGPRPVFYFIGNLLIELKMGRGPIRGFIIVPKSNKIGNGPIPD